MDTKAIEPLPGTRVLITQTRKAGTTGLSYASMTTYPNDGVGLHRTHPLSPGGTTNQNCVGQDTFQGKL